jgi:FkbM family methyltransferase
MTGSTATGGKLSPTRYVFDPNRTVVGESDMQEWLWPAQDVVQASLAFARLHDLYSALEHVRKRDVCVQAGGNMGVWPKHLAEHFTTVYTFEPDPLNFRCLAANVPEENVFKFNAGLGVLPVCLEMRRTDNCGAHRMDYERAGPVPLLRLDDFGLDGCDFLQLDIEGCELAALSGGRDLIARCRPVIMVEDKPLKREAIERGKGLETASSTCSRWLHDRGYTLAAAFTENGSTDFLYVWQGSK